MKKSTLIYLSIISILFTAVLYLLFLNFNKNSPKSLPPKTDIVSTEESEPDTSPISGWKTYNNSNYNFSIDYDAEKYLLEEEENFTSIREKSMIGKDTHGYTGIYFSFYSDKNLDQVIQSDNNNTEYTDTYSKTNIIINNLTFIKTSEGTAIGDTVESLYIQAKNGVIKISTPGGLSSFNQILSTFKFL